MRKINDIILHCSATKEGRDFTVADIDRWHKARGWRCIGYHFVVYRDGTVHPGRPVEQIGAHTSNHNARSIGICYVGGLDTSGKPNPRTRARPNSAQPCAVWSPTWGSGSRTLPSTATATTPPRPALHSTSTRSYSANEKLRYRKFSVFRLPSTALSFP